MRYWEIWCLTFGAGCMVGVVIAPMSWGAAITGLGVSLAGWQLYKRRTK